MAIISYAQNFEDVMLWRALQHVERGFYIDVGAQSPDVDSVTRTFSDAGWSGINVEPHPTYHAQLVERRPRDINLRCALGDSRGVATIHLVGATGLSTLDTAIADRHKGIGHPIEQIEVAVETLSTVWARHVPVGQAVHFLKIDVEGFEARVLRGHDWRRHRPWVVVVESTLPNSQEETHSEWEPQMMGAHYDFVYADGLNRYYLAQEMSMLRGAFRYPPNVHDDFVMAPLASARQELAQTRVSLSDAEAGLDLLRAQLAQTEVRLKSELDNERDCRTQVESRLASEAARASGLEAALRGSQDQLALCESSLASKNAQLGQLSEHRDELLRDLAHGAQALDEKARQLDVMSVALEESRARELETGSRAAAAEASLLVARNDVGRLGNELAALYRSRSWRLTAPARFVGRLWRRKRT